MFSGLPQDIMTGILGEINLSSFIVYMIYAYIGIIGNLISDLLRRNKESESSPKKLTPKYWWKDNKFRLALSMFSVPFFLTLYTDIFGLNLSKSVAFFIGISSDHLWEILKRKNIIANATEEEI